MATETRLPPKLVALRVAVAHVSMIEQDFIAERCALPPDHPYVAEVTYEINALWRSLERRADRLGLTQPLHETSDDDD